MARVECGTPVQQPLRGSPRFRAGPAWFDAVQFRVPSTSPNDEARGQVEPQYQKVREILC